MTAKELGRSFRPAIKISLNEFGSLSRRLSEYNLSLADMYGTAIDTKSEWYPNTESLREQISTTLTRKYSSWLLRQLLFHNHIVRIHGSCLSQLLLNNIEGVW
jgi:hypothetical protein